jgi:LysR family glycine cleavage system transcriptional activator
MDEINSSVRPPRGLPSLSALRAFESAAAHGSFLRAADELSVTPAAISHQVRGLEQALGLALFERQPRRVVLTPDGTRLFQAVKEGLDVIELGLSALRRSRATVTLTTNTAFAGRWLLPRLVALREACPQVDLRLHATESVADLGRGEADLAVRSGDGRWPQLAVQLLAAERYAPMCSPALGVKAARDLARQRLIHAQWSTKAFQPAVWPRWFRAAGLKPPRSGRDLHFTDESHAILATLGGQGVALLSLTLMRPELESGALVQPFGPVLPTGGYYLATARGREREPALQQVWAWLAQAMAAD